MTRAWIEKGKPVLCGGRTSPSAAISLVAFPTLVTMTISGLWHGAGWQFVAWGALHGAYLTVNQCWRLWRRRLWGNEARYERILRPIYHLLTFASVVLALVLFRSNSMATARKILANLLGFNGILSHLFSVTEQAGVSITGSIWIKILPWSIFAWIVALLIAVMWLPNSQEYVSRLESAFGLSIADKTADLTAVRGHASFLMRTSSVALMASITALMCALGFMAVDRGGGFIYGAF
jgi:alginate O-acetyltransferase complex protein AlgI